MSAPSSESENLSIKVPDNCWHKILSQSGFEMKPTIACCCQCLLHFRSFISFSVESNHCQKVKVLLTRFSLLNMAHVTILLSLNGFPRKSLKPRYARLRSDRSKLQQVSAFHFIFRQSRRRCHSTASILKVRKQFKVNSLLIPIYFWTFPGTAKGILCGSENALSHKIDADAFVSWFPWTMTTMGRERART